jgi:hypothetical protein
MFIVLVTEYIASSGGATYRGNHMSLLRSLRDLDE